MTTLVLVVVTVAVWVVTDAAGLRGFLGQRVGGRAPWQWFLATLVAAPVALPVYLRQRHRLLGRHRRWEMGTLELLDPPVLDPAVLDPPVLDPAVLDAVAPAPPEADDADRAPPTAPAIDLRPPAAEVRLPRVERGDRRRLVAVGGTKRWFSDHLRRR